MIIHCFADYEVTLRIFVKYEIIPAEPLPRFIVLVITVTFGPVECGRPDKAFSKQTGIVQLQMMLRIVVSIIIIITDITVLVIIFPGRVIPSVSFVLGQIDSVPGYACVLISEEPGQTERIPLVHPSQNSKGRLNISKGIPYISVGQSAGIRKIEVQSRTGKSGTCCSRSCKCII